MKGPPGDSGPVGPPGPAGQPGKDGLSVSALFSSSVHSLHFDIRNRNMKQFPQNVLLKTKQVDSFFEQLPKSDCPVQIIFLLHMQTQT